MCKYSYNNIPLNDFKTFFNGKHMNILVKNCLTRHSSYIMTKMVGQGYNNKIINTYLVKELVIAAALFKFMS